MLWALPSLIVLGTTNILLSSRPSKMVASRSEDGLQPLIDVLNHIAWVGRALRPLLAFVMVLDALPKLNNIVAGRGDGGLQPRLNVIDALNYTSGQCLARHGSSGGCVRLEGHNRADQSPRRGQPHWCYTMHVVNQCAAVMSSCDCLF